MLDMEIYRNSEPTVKVDVPLQTATYSVSIINDDGTLTPVPSANNLSPAAATQQITLVIPFEYTEVDGVIRLEITMMRQDGGNAVFNEFIDVVTPLFTWHDLDGSYKREETPELERLVRHVIEAYTGQYFGKRKDRRTINSSQSVINFNVPLIEFTGVSGRYMTHTTTLTPPKIPYEILNEGHTLAIDLENYDVKTDSLWILNTRRQGCYVMEGTFGYDRVPQDVKQAALLIAGMWGCNQAVWRDRFISTMRSADWSVAYHDAGFGHTTGSHGADMLLSKYSQRYNPAVI